MIGRVIAFGFLASFLYQLRKVSLFPIVIYNGPREYTFRQSQHLVTPTC